MRHATAAMLIFAQVSWATGAAKPPLLAVNQRLEIHLTGSGTEILGLDLRQGQLATLSLERHGSAVIVEVFGPGGERLVEFPDDGGFNGTVSLPIPATTGGNYEVHLRPRYLTPASQTFAVRLALPTRASDQDVAQFDALTASTASERETRAGHYDQAVVLAEQAVSTHGSGDEDALLGELYYRLGVTQFNKARREPARTALETALRIDRAVLGEDSPGSGRALIALGHMYDSFADVPKAEDALRRARMLIEAAWGSAHPWIADCLEMSAKVSQHRGDFNHALAEINDALAIDQAYPTADSRHLILDMDARADIYLDLHDFDHAEQGLQETLRLEEQHLVPDHPWVAHSLQNLGIIARRHQQYPQALDYFWRAEAIREHAYGPEHPSTASLLVNIGNVYHAEGDDVRAEQAFQEAIARFTESIGPYHEWTIMTLANLTKSYAAQSDIPRALDTLRRTNEASETTLALNLSVGSERSRLSYADKFADFTKRAISLNISQAPQNSLATELAAQVILQRKGRILDALADNMASLRRRLEPEDQALLDELSNVTSEFAKVALHGAGDLSHDEYRKKLDALQLRQEALETSISARSSGFYQNPQAVTLAAVRAAVPEDAVLLEFALYQPFDVHGVDTAADAPSRYAVYLIPAEGELQVRDLGPAKELDQMVDEFRRALRDTHADPTSQAQQLYTRVLAPLKGKIPAAAHLIISPDGSVNLVPFEALVDEQGRYLLSQHEISYVSSGRDLLRFADRSRTSGAPVIVADPDFGEPAAPPTRPVLRAAGARRSITTAPDLATVYFAPLSGTAREARNLKTLFPEAALLTGDQATKANLKILAAPAILHIATHGFFVDHEARPLEPGAADPRGLRATSGIENPLLRSGLALAGANLDRGDREDGILTALEAANLNLWGTRLVTLSACDTGIGEIRNGEGVYGLRRAFVLAGAETLVMSLWPVSDAVTRRLMFDYYRGLKDGLGRGPALRRAQLAMMSRAGRSHPFYWASFIQAGQWAALDGSR